ncbi:ribosome biogenesis protein WDR12 homolog [Wolffia australiana]
MEAATDGSRTLADLNADALTHCASFLGLSDLARMAMACRTLHQAAYSDSIWRRLFRESWPQNFIPLETSGARAAYLARRNAVRQFKFDDPVMFNLPAYALPQSHLLFDRDDIILAQGSSIQILKVDTSTWETTCEAIRAHNSRITCVRLIPLNETFLFRNEMQKNENTIVTSSSDHTIRLWWKGRSQRCFKGHNVPVTTLADRLLGKSGTKLLASGGEDGSIRLWSLGSSVKRQPFVATFHGHERPISFLTVAEHNPSLLLSISKDAKLRVWDATMASRSSSCVGMSAFSGHPVGIKCHESLCYVASGSSVTAVDLRTMKKVSAIATHPPKLHSFAMAPSKSLIWTGGDEKAILWDVRRAKAMAVLDGHLGPVAMIHADGSKVVTGGPKDLYVKVWEADNGALVRSLECYSDDLTEVGDEEVGLSAMAVDGCRIVTGGFGEGPHLLCFRDYSNSSVLIADREQGPSSKFWEEPASSS